MYLYANTTWIVKKYTVEFSGAEKCSDVDI